MSKSDFQYEINNFYISGDHLVINGWGKMIGNMQHYLNDNTHSYSIVLMDIKTGKQINYNGRLLWTDKTNYFKRVSTHRLCSSGATYQDEDYCYFTIQNIAFEFNIPLSDLDKDTSYRVILRMHSKIVNVAYQTYLFAPAIRDYQEKNGIRYELSSDYSTTRIFVLSEMLFVKGGPSLESSRLTSWHWCSLTGYTMYWKQWEAFTSLQEVAKTSNSYDAETWFRVLFDQGLCVGGRSRAYMGWSYSGWMPSSYTDFDGTPAVIKITTQNYASIDQIKTYTAPKGSETKVKLNLYNRNNQTNNIKLYNNGNLVYNQNITYNGVKEIEVRFDLIDAGNVEAVITEPSGYVTKLKSNIYISDFKEYSFDTKDATINSSTPIIVITDKNGTNNIYENIKISIPYSFTKITSGKSISAWSFIEYATSNNEIALNNNISGNAKFPTQESTLNHAIVDNLIKVDLIITDSNSSQALLNLPEYILDKNKGYVYLKGTEPPNIKTIYGDRKWYVPMIDHVGNYNYIVELKNVGVNKASIKFKVTYEIVKTLFGYKDSQYIIKRSSVPDNLIFRFKEHYTFDELLNFGVSP